MSESQPRPEAMQIQRAGTVRVPGPAESFTGQVVLESYFTAPSPARVGGATVSFAPGAWPTGSCCRRFSS